MRPRIPSLRLARVVGAIERSWRQTCERARFRLIHYSLQDDHAHLIVEAANTRELANGMKSLGARLARAVHRVFRLRGAVLDGRFHARVLLTPREVWHAIAYVLLNARRHLAKRGLRVPRKPVPDPASSGRWFDGWREGLGCAHGPPAVATAQTWLLRVGWRREGLVGLAEIPGGPGK